MKQQIMGLWSRASADPADGDDGSYENRCAVCSERTACPEARFQYTHEYLFDVELASFKSLEPSIVFLHPQITDLALAFGNRDLFQLYFKVMRGRFGVEPGLATNNFGWLLPRLNEWGLEPCVVSTPFNPRGFLMKPTQAACEQLLLSKSGTLIADQVETAPYSDDDVRNYFRKHGIRAAILEFHDDATLAARVRTLKSCLV